ncbi:MAG: hypothetical protein AAF732_20265 [Pseudomonadota bacterium]
MLTPRTRDVLVFIIKCQTETGIAPTLDEMTSAAKLSSKSGVIAVLKRLEQGGFIRRKRHKACAITVLKSVPNVPLPVFPTRTPRRTLARSASGHQGQARSGRSRHHDI